MKNTPVTSGRLYYLDWLRVLGMFGIFFFHNARFYDSFTDWTVKNATTNLGATMLIAIMSNFIMPLFFLVSGAAVYYALRSRKAGQFVQERSLRLLIPLIFGMLIIVAPQAYFGAVSHGEMTGGYNFLQIYWLYLQTLPDLNWFHLWYLAYLLVFSLVALPVFVNWKGGKSVISRMATALNNPWAWLAALVLLLAVVDIFLDPGGYWGDRTQANFSRVAYLLFFIAGYLIFANARIMEAIEKLRWWSLGAGIAGLACGALFFYDILIDREAYFGSGGFAASQIVMAIVTWGWLFAFLGLAKRYLNSTNRFLAYANEAVLPFYILHQTVIISIGFCVVQWNMHAGLKYLMISTTSFIGIMLIYELLVRRVNVFRFLFGMRTVRTAQPMEVKEGSS